MIHLSLDRLTRHYPGGVTAVSALSLEVEQGEFIALLGPSGCGKSTTLRMIAGLEEISEGELRIRGERANERPPQARGAAMVFQSYALYPHMNAYENMAFGLRLKKLPEAEIDQRVRRAAGRLELTELLDRRPAQLSGGQRQRIAMGRALVREPEIFLFDEPLSNLDAQLRSSLRIELGQLHREQGATSLYVTHDQIEAMTLADRIVLLKDGVVQQIGAPLELYHRPANRFVATFIGQPTMNLLPAVVNDNAIDVLGHRLPLPPQLTATPGESLQLGVRPGALQLCEAPAEAADAFAAEVYGVEALGGETLLRCQQGDHKLVLQHTGSPRVQLGEKVWISIPSEAIHLFSNDETGRRL
ncbi:MAG: sn-glycerol-3-phosphate ABC transporter ATP-binding protein UgpC [Myxococcota bacterium]|nr:sn-glycerol-3-phosphate ABC transporter ATP-binding protein UgpC [Myxococcota bacterium]